MKKIYEKTKVGDTKNDVGFEPLDESKVYEGVCFQQNNI